MELKLRLPPDLLEQEAVQTEPLTLASLIAQLRKDFQEACKPTNPPWSRSLQQLFGWLEKYVEFQTHQVQFASLSWVFSRGTAVGRSHECHEHQPADSALSVDDFLASLHRTDEAGLAGVTRSRSVSLQVALGSEACVFRQHTSRPLCAKHTALVRGYVSDAAPSSFIVQRNTGACTQLGDA